MRQTLPKIFSVMLAVASLVVLGTTVIGFMYGSPDVVSESLNGQLDGYEVTPPQGETGKWSVTRRSDGQSVGGNLDSGYAALIAAYNDKKSVLTAETSQYQQQYEAISGPNGVVTTFDALQQQDEAGIDVRLDELSIQAEAMAEAFRQTSAKLQSASDETKTVRDETERLRNDVARLQTELEETRTDRYRVEELRRELTDRLVRLQLEIQAMQLRKQQLAGSLSNP